jgi:hypothetical protein
VNVIKCVRNLFFRLVMHKFTALIFFVLLMGCQHQKKELIVLNENNKAFVASGLLHKNLYVSAVEFPETMGLNYLEHKRDEQALADVLAQGLDAFLYKGDSTARYQLRIKFIELTYDPPPRNTSQAIWVSPRLAWVASSRGYSVAEFRVIDTSTGEQVGEALSKRKGVFKGGEGIPLIMGKYALEKSVAKSVVDLTTFLKELELQLKAKSDKKLSA